MHYDTTSAVMSKIEGHARPVGKWSQQQVNVARDAGQDRSDYSTSMGMGPMAATTCAQVAAC